MAVSFDGRKIVFRYGTTFIKYALWTDKDDVIINQLKNCDSDELELILDKCSESNDGSVKELVGAHAETFQYLPQDIKQALSDLFWPKKPKPIGGWFSGWW
jgi:hypothetical protein